MAAVTFKIIKSGNNFSDTDTLIPAYKEGQLIFVEAQQKIYLDYNDRRTCYASASGGGSSTGNGLNYLGISTTDPTSGTVTINGVVITPTEKDMVVYNTKEYIWR